jgi:hypothetical protein
MNIPKMISDLRAEKNRLDEAIGALERLSAGSKNKRRPKPEKLPDPSTDADIPHARTY